MIGGFIMTKCLSHADVTQPPTAQIWCPATSSFSQNLNHIWKGRDFRLSMRFRKIQGRWRQLWNCVTRSQGAYFEGDWGVTVLCTMFLVSSSRNVSIFHITWLRTFWTDLVCTNLFTSFSLPRITLSIFSFIFDSSLPQKLPLALKAFPNSCSWWL